MRFRLLCVPVALAVLTPAASAQTSAVVDIDTTQTTPLNPGFSGFNDEVVFPAEYFDYRLNNLAAQLSASWVRYPSGLFSDAFNWQTGLMVPSWMSQFRTTSLATLLNESVPWVNGKGGGSFADAARPSAVVAVFAIDAGDTSSNPAWDRALAAYPNKYWDAVTFHHYPPQSTGAFSQWMADENAVLAAKSSTYITGYLAPLLPAGTRFVESEFLPSNDGMGSGTSLTNGTLYGAIYAAEYAMRMSTVPSLIYICGTPPPVPTRWRCKPQPHPTRLRLPLTAWFGPI